MQAQRSFTDLGQPLVDTTFTVLDFETTGGSPSNDVITEVGAIKVCGGRDLGTFATLVNPGRAIPPTITVLTGITNSSVAKAPRIESVLGSLVDFIGESVLVAHNLRFDLGFLNAALERDGRPTLSPQTVDTVALSRRLLGGEMPNCKLSTLAKRLSLPNQPSHRALQDALATADLLHVLMERAAAYGVTGIEDLASLPKMANHPQAAKLRLTERLPKCPGVYLFRDGSGNVLYVGKATDLRSRVRSYFSGDERRKVQPLLRSTQRIDHKRCSTSLEAAVLEARLIRDLTPQYNSQGTRWKKACYLKLTLDERFPRLSVVRTASTGVLLGPISSTKKAKMIAEAIESVVPLRRCTARVPHKKTNQPNGEHIRTGACAPAQIGVSTCPCNGDITDKQYSSHVELTQRAIAVDPHVLFEPLDKQMSDLADQERFEEASAVRDRLESLAVALQRKRRFDALLNCERLVLRVVATGECIELRRGVLWKVWQPDTLIATDVQMRPAELPDPSESVAKGLADELIAVAAWIDRYKGAVVVDWVDGTFASRFPRIPRFTAKKAGKSKK